LALFFKLCCNQLNFTVFVILMLSIRSVAAQNSIHERIYTQVDHMPQLISCATSNGNMYKMDRCTNMALKAWFLANMQYPAEALKLKSQEKFGFIAVVDTLGKLSGLEPTKVMSSECAMEAHRLVQLLLESDQTWISGQQGRKKVKVQFELCVEFNVADWNAELLRRQKMLEVARQDSILKSPKVDSLPKKGK